jgi:hypothetical protein
VLFDPKNRSEVAAALHLQYEFLASFPTDAVNCTFDAGDPQPNRTSMCKVFDPSSPTSPRLLCPLSHSCLHDALRAICKISLAHSRSLPTATELRSTLRHRSQHNSWWAWAPCSTKWTGLQQALSSQRSTPSSFHRGGLLAPFRGLHLDAALLTSWSTPTLGARPRTMSSGQCGAGRSSLSTRPSSTANTQGAPSTHRLSTLRKFGPHPQTQTRPARSVFSLTFRSQCWSSTTTQVIRKLPPQYPLDWRIACKHNGARTCRMALSRLNRSGYFLLKVRVGAIRWDNWSGRTSPTSAETAACMGPQQWHSRVPFCGKVINSTTVDFDCATSSAMALELQ